jgi:hypothetical protein
MIRAGVAGRNRLARGGWRRTRKRLEPGGNVIPGRNK